MDVDAFSTEPGAGPPPPTLQAIPTPPGYIRRTLGPRDWDVDLLVADMDRNSIQYAVVMSGGIQVTNANLAEAVRRYPDRFVAFASYDHFQPNSQDHDVTDRAVGALRDGVGKLGFRGIGEIHVDRFSPTPPDLLYVELRPIMDVARTFGVPVYFHMSFEPLTHRIRRDGPEGSPWRFHPAPLPYRDPVYLDSALIEYPDVTVLVGHMGGPFKRHFEGALMLALRHPNVYLTTANAPAEHIAAAVDTIGPERIIWGSDWAATRRWHRKGLAALDGAGLTGAQKEAIVGRNVARLLNIASD
jgi:predicted TIM-barrel fold metal-dependent hydrolase